MHADQPAVGRLRGAGTVPPPVSSERGHSHIEQISRGLMALMGRIDLQIYELRTLHEQITAESAPIEQNDIKADGGTVSLVVAFDALEKTVVRLEKIVFSFRGC